MFILLSDVGVFTLVSDIPDPSAAMFASEEDVI